MCSFLSVRWTVKPLTAPRPLLPCSGCGKLECFRSSGKFRLNANGKRLDAWLLYRCIQCEATWKRPIIQRRNVQALDPVFLRALQSNSAALADSLAFDLEGLRRFAPTIDVCGEITVAREVLTDDMAPADLSQDLETSTRGTRFGCSNGLEISLSVPVATALRTDRLLASELMLPRARIRQLEKTGRLLASLNGRHKTKRPIADRLSIRLALSGESDADRIRRAAAHGTVGG